MTSNQLREKIDNTIQHLTERQLYLVYSIAEAFANQSIQSQNTTSDGHSTTLPPKNPKFGGRRISDDVARLAMGYEVAGTDEDIDNKIHKYLQEKYK